MEVDNVVRLEKPVVVSPDHLKEDLNKLHGEAYGVDWIWGRSFGEVMKEIQTRSCAMYRGGWNGKDQFVYWVPPASYPAQTGIAKAVFGEDAVVPYEGYFALKNAQGKVSVWVPSTGDLQATDWAVIEEDQLFLKFHPRPKKTGSLTYVGDPELGGIAMTNTGVRYHCEDVEVYVGTKRVKAKPMTRGEYNAYRGWVTPENEDPEEAGYLIEYLDGGKPNHKMHAGYISWSPKDVFDNAYKKE